MSFVRLLDKTLARVETWMLVIFLGAMVLLAFAQVVLRNFFGTGFLWGDTVVRHLVLWAGFIGGALAAFEGRHISIDALTKFFSPRYKHLSAALTHLFGAIVCWFLADAAWRFTMDEKAAGSIIVLSIPSWVAMLIIPVGYVLIMVHFLLKVIEHGAGAVQPELEA
jgi:TRAP-type C4-dicarboxylate transport system permease small subunit